MLSCILLGLLVAGCDSTQPADTVDEEKRFSERSPAHTPGSAAPDAVLAPEYGGRIITGSIGEASNLIYPLASDSASHEIADLLYIAPLKYDKDLQIIPWAAENYEVLQEGRLLRFTLRKGMLWQDGKEVTAEDAEFTYKLMIDPKTPTAYAENFKVIKEFKVIDRYTFEVAYERPYAPALTTWMSGLLPKHVLKGENLLSTRYSRDPVGAGPYRLKEWIPGQRVTLVARDDYFEGRPYLDEVVFRIIPDMSTMFLELKSGNLDWMGLTPQQYLFQTQGKQWEKDYRKFKYLSFGYTYLGYNLSNPLFTDVRVRQALAHAINKQEIIKGVLLGLGVPTIGPYKPGTWMYNEKIVDYVYDPNKAKTLLAEAGWRDSNGDGLLEKDKTTFSFTILTNQGNEMRVKAATIIQSRLKEIGIEVKIRTVEWAAFLKEFVDKRQFDALILGWSISQDPDIYEVWHSSKAMPGGLNHVGYSNHELDALLDDGRHTLDQGRRKEIYDRVQEIFHRDQPYCFLFVPYALPIIQSRFQGIEPASSGLTWNFIRWWTPKSAQRVERIQ